MSEVELSSNYVESQFNELKKGLENLDNDNFDDEITSIKLCIDRIHQAKKLIYEKTHREKFVTLDKIFRESTKLINKCFDNEINKRKAELDSVKNQLNALQNQKKLTTYKR